jgi:hypothetical protein
MRVFKDGRGDILHISLILALMPMNMKTSTQRGTRRAIIKMKGYPILLPQRALIKPNPETVPSATPSYYTFSWEYLCLHAPDCA